MSITLYYGKWLYCTDLKDQQTLHWLCRAHKEYEYSDTYSYILSLPLSVFLFLFVSGKEAPFIGWCGNELDRAVSLLTLHCPYTSNHGVRPTLKTSCLFLPVHFITHQKTPTSSIGIGQKYEDMCMKSSHLANAKVANRCLKFIHIKQSKLHLLNDQVTAMVLTHMNSIVF